MIGKVLASVGVAAFLTTVAGTPGWADTAKVLGKYGDWKAFTFTDKAGKVCYATSLPKHSLDVPKDRSDTYLSITHRPKDKSFDVVSITSGFAFKKDAPAEIDIGGNKFALFTQGETAWTRDDKAVVQAMLKGKTLIVHWESAKGNNTSDTYSLDGFLQAHAAIDKACGDK